MNAFIIPTEDLFLLGILASDVVWGYLKCVCAALGNASTDGRLLLKAEFMKDVPIPTATTKDRSTIIQMVRDCLEAKGNEVADIERQLDATVRHVYGLGKQD